jgi:CPA2 family monovalent cation:H+ antiporter-2
MIKPMTRWLDRHPRVLALLERRNRRRAPPAAGAQAAGLRNHAVIVGYGRVGSVVGHALEAQGLRFAVIETHQRIVEDLRTRDIVAIQGDASAAGVLDLAGIEHARLLVIASPDGFQARRILELARERNPRIAVVVRTHSSSELAYLIRQGVDRAVMGELELALEMTDYALRSLGVAEERAKLVTQWLRTQEISRPK